MTEPNLPNDAVREASLLLCAVVDALDDYQRIWSTSASPYYVLIVPEETIPRVEQYTTLDEAATAVNQYIGTPAHVFVFRERVPLTRSRSGRAWSLGGKPIATADDETVELLDGNVRLESFTAEAEEQPTAVPSGN